MITPAISNEMRANYSNHRVSTESFLDNFGGAVPLVDSLLFPLGYSSANSSFGLFIPGAGQFNQGRSVTGEQRQVNFVDNLSVTAAGHQWKVGVDCRWLAPLTRPYSYRQFVQFSGMTAAPGGALSGIAVSAATFAYEGNALLSRNFSLYGQDTWKVTRRFHTDLWPAVGCQPADQGQGRHERTVHGDGSKQSNDDRPGASRHSALPDNLWKRREFGL